MATMWMGLLSGGSLTSGFLPHGNSIEQNMNNIAAEWDLDPNVTYLNHGSFGPSPKSIRDARERWSARLERQPMDFYLQQMEAGLDEAASALGNFLHTKPQHLAMVDNATFAMNVCAQSVKLNTDDEVLLTDHEYGAVRNIWQEACRRQHARMTTATLPIELHADQILDALEAARTPATKVVIFSHVTSPTAVALPAKEICQWARQHNIIAVVDGPHAVGLLDVDLNSIACDYYCASCHKWLCAPFGCGFVWVAPRHQKNVRFPLVSWGGSLGGRPPRWQDAINWLGTRDPAPMLALPDTFDFWKSVRLKTFRNHAADLIDYASERLNDQFGIPPMFRGEHCRVPAMRTFRLPEPADWQPGYHGKPDPLQLELKQRFHIEIPVASWNNQRYLRLSAHLYNNRGDIDRLIDALASCEQLS